MNTLNEDLKKFSNDLLNELKTDFSHQNAFVSNHKKKNCIFCETKADDDSAVCNICEIIYTDERDPFTKAKDKVIYSEYFRALTDKTQVMPLTENTHTHTRLSHSLEVACVGRSFGKKLAKLLMNKLPDIKEEQKNDLLNYLPTILEVACLVHDIGNPAFGHGGEQAIKHFFKTEFTKDSNNHFNYKNLRVNEQQYKELQFFDGNANGFRIITKLAGKDEKNGLKFPPIILKAGMKYPFIAGDYPENPKKEKFGYFSTEEEAYNKLRLKDKQRNPLVYLVEAADDICNLIIDFEDALKNGIISWVDFNKHIKVIPTESADFVTLDPNEDKEVIKAIDDLTENYNHCKPLTMAESKHLECIRAHAIGMLTKLCFGAFVNNLETIINKGPVEFSLINSGIAKKLGNEKYENYKDIKKGLLDDRLYQLERNTKIEIAAHKMMRFLLKRFLSAASEFQKNNGTIKLCS